MLNLKPAIQAKASYDVYASVYTTRSHARRSRGVPVADLGHDQESTDLQKCVAYVLRAQRAAAANGGAAPAPHAEQPQGGPPVIVALGAHGGRLDHMLGHLSTLCMHRHTDLVLLGDGNLSRLLRAGRSVVRPHRAREGPSCGLVPLEGRAVASSRGLRWNLGARLSRRLRQGAAWHVRPAVPMLALQPASGCAAAGPGRASGVLLSKARLRACSADKTEMRFGGLVSTSNIIDADQIEVESDSDLLWTTELNEDPGIA